MFDSLSDRFEGIFKRLRGRGKLTEKDIDEVAREIRLALLEADVNVRVVKSFAAEKAQIGVLAAAARRLQWASVRQIDVRARYAPIMEGLPRLGMAAVLLYGGILAIDGRVTIGTIVAAVWSENWKIHGAAISAAPTM